MTAMRVAPLGAYFADDLVQVREQALASAAPTHAHPDGQAGAVAVAIAAAMAWHLTERPDAGLLFRTVLAHTPEGPTRQGIEKASELLERDFNLPPFDELVAELDTVRNHLARTNAGGRRAA